MSIPEIQSKKRACLISLWCGCCLFGLGCTQTTTERVSQYNQDGVYLYQQGDYIRARECFKEANRLKPNDPGILYNLAQCYDSQGKDSDAEKIYRQCLNVEPNHAPTHQALARLLLLQGRRQEADQMIKAWLVSQPKKAEAFVNDAFRLQQNGEFLKAQGRLQQALNLDPQNVDALIELGMLYERIERPDRALVLYQEALAKHPHRSDIRNRVNALIAQGVKKPLPDG